VDGGFACRGSVDAVVARDRRCSDEVDTGASACLGKSPNSIRTSRMRFFQRFFDIPGVLATSGFAENSRIILSVH